MRLAELTLSRLPNIVSMQFCVSRALVCILDLQLTVSRTSEFVEVKNLIGPVGPYPALHIGRARLHAKGDWDSCRRRLEASGGLCAPRSLWSQNLRLIGRIGMQ